jgi:SpoVK/Ycf46/Vps4 family AAA+-type ATPase
MNQYFDKYTPINSVDFIEHFKFTNDFKNHIKNNIIFNKLIICIGPSGCGKTSLLKQIFEEYKYNYREININSKVDEIHNYLYTKSIEDFFTTQKKLIFIDDFEVFINDKNHFNNLSNLNLENQKIPIVCVLNKLYDRNRKIIDLKKNATILYLNKPKFNSIYKYVISILDNEKIELNNIILENTKLFIQNYKNNIKLILLNLDDLILNNLEKKKTYNDNQIDKFNDIGLFDIVDNLYNKKNSIIELNNIAYNDSNLVCMLLHENMIIQFESRFKTKTEILSKYLDILDNMCYGDMIEKNIFTNNNWNLLNTLYIVKIYNINKVFSENKCNNYIKNNFTQILTKYSLRCNYNKKRIQLLTMLNISNNYFNYILPNILYKIQYIHNNKNDEHLVLINSIIKYYNLYNKDILNLIIKYNKIFSVIDNGILNKLKNNNK